MLTLKRILKLKWVGLQGPRERWVIAFEESLARYPNGRVWFPCRPSHPRFRLTTTQTRWKVHQALHQSNLDQLSVLPALYDNDDTSPFKSSKQNLTQQIPQSLLSSRIGRGTYPRNLGIELCSICQQFAPRFAMPLRHQTAAASLLFSDGILTVHLRY